MQSLGWRRAVWIPWGARTGDIMAGFYSLAPFLSSQPDSQPPPRSGCPGHRSGSERKPHPHIPSVSPWGPNPPHRLHRTVGPHQSQLCRRPSLTLGIPHMVSEASSRLQVVTCRGHNPCPLLCFLRLIHGEANRWEEGTYGCASVSCAQCRGHLESFFKICFY